MVLFAHYRDVKFPVAYRVYKGKSTPTPTTLAREMLRAVSHSIRSRFRIRVLADSGFEAAAFLDEVRQLGFEFVVGVRANRRTVHPGEVKVSDCPHGGYVELKNWPYETLTLGRFDRGDRTFHAVSSELMEGDEVIAEGKERWNEESFFKEGKHQFGLAQFATRTAVGLDRWILLVFLAWTLAILHRQDGLTLEECAFLALVTVLPETLLDWPAPQGQKHRPARWLENAASYREFFESVLAEEGEDALASIWNDAPRGPGARLTRWFYPGVPMHATGEQTLGPNGRTRHSFLVPARAALLALERGLVTCRPQPEAA